MGRDEQGSGISVLHTNTKYNFHDHIATTGTFHFKRQSFKPHTEHFSLRLDTTKLTVGWRDVLSAVPEMISHRF